MEQQATFQTMFDLIGSPDGWFHLVEISISLFILYCENVDLGMGEYNLFLKLCLL